MPPRKTTDFGALFAALVEDLRIQLAASVDRAVADVNRRLTRVERRLDQLDPEGCVEEPQGSAGKRACSLCERDAVARGLCSAHYQQWRYRERRAKLVRRAQAMASQHVDSNVRSSVVKAISPDN